jgi:hypothetical protein
MSSHVQHLIQLHFEKINLKYSKRQWQITQQLEKYSQVSCKVLKIGCLPQPLAPEPPHLVP